MNLLKLVDFQINFKTRMKVGSILEGLSRESTDHKRRRGGLTQTLHGESAKTSVSFPPGRSRASGNKRPRRTPWKRTTRPQGMELKSVGESRLPEETIQEKSDC